MKMRKGMTNAQVSKLLRSVAAAYEVKGKETAQTRFRIIAYQNAADSIEHSTSEVGDLWKEGKLDEVPGVGAGLAKYLDELFKTGKVKHFAQVLNALPPALFELLDIPGIGAKRAYKLVRELGITKEHGAVEKLAKAAQKGRIRTVEGFGEQSEAEILQAIQGVKRKTKRFLYPYAAEVAEEVLAYLRKSKIVVRADPLGSLRRQVATVGDIDVAVASDKPAEVIKYFTAYPKKTRIIEAGGHTASILLPNGMSVDLMVQPLKAYGALLQHFTGSKNHNVGLRTWAARNGMSVSEYGIKKGKKLHMFATEEEFYRFLGMEWIPPELREDAGEIEGALRDVQGKHFGLPKLIEVADIKGDFHLHSNFLTEVSHDVGADSMEEMVEEGDRLGYEYMLFTEHNPKSELSEKKVLDMLKRKREHIEKINYSRENGGESRVKKVYNGLEIDIRPDGSLVLPERAFGFLDFALVAVHSSFRGTARRQTARVLRGLEHPKAKILAHPAARRINEREEIQLEWDKLFDFCVKNDKWLEINSWWDRLDLPDVLVREAVKAGVKLVISTDAHAASHMQGIKYGVSVARRGWAQEKDIVNTLSYREFAQLVE